MISYIILSKPKIIQIMISFYIGDCLFDYILWIISLA